MGLSVAPPPLATLLLLALARRAWPKLPWLHCGGNRTGLEAVEDCRLPDGCASLTKLFRANANCGIIGPRP